MSTLIVVRRAGHNATETYEHLEANWVPKFGPDVTLMWDRRTDSPSGFDDGAERFRDERSLLKSEHAERRRRPPAIWGTLGFLVVSGGNGDA